MTWNTSSSSATAPYIEIQLPSTEKRFHDAGDENLVEVDHDKQKMSPDQSEVLKCVPWVMATSSRWTS